MSTNFGYGEDFKIIGYNQVTFNIGVRRTYKKQHHVIEPCENNYVAIKGSAIVSLTNYTFERAEKMEDLGVVLSENLSWLIRAKKRAEAAIKALYTV